MVAFAVKSTAGRHRPGSGFIGLHTVTQASVVPVEQQLQRLAADAGNDVTIRAASAGRKVFIGLSFVSGQV
jgi:hypothetical protein